jgi:hypothetical protein
MDMCITAALNTLISGKNCIKDESAGLVFKNRCNHEDKTACLAESSALEKHRTRLLRRFTGRFFVRTSKG